MPVMRTYVCSECKFSFEKFHLSRDEPPPEECPACAHASIEKGVGRINIGTNKGRAIDMAQKIAEEDFGLTDMRDNQRAGDVAAMGPSPMQTAEREQIQQEMVEMARSAGAQGQEIPVAIEQAMQATGQGGFWQGQHNPVATDPNLPKPPPAPGHVDSVGMLEKGRDRGISTKMRYDVVGRAEMNK